jgi:hypothetical protein
MIHRVRSDFCSYGLAVPVKSSIVTVRSSDSSSVLSSDISSFGDVNVGVASG